MIVTFFSIIILTIFLSEFLERIDQNDKNAYEYFKYIIAYIGFILFIYLGYSYSIKKIL